VHCRTDCEAEFSPAKKTCLLAGESPTPTLTPFVLPPVGPVAVPPRTACDRRATYDRAFESSLFLRRGQNESPVFPSPLGWLPISCSAEELRSLRECTPTCFRRAPTLAYSSSNARPEDLPSSWMCSRWVPRNILRYGSPGTSPGAVMCNVVRRTTDASTISGL